ncbi:MAG TPA: hypothetical protein VFI21_04420 [Nocardioides sp.]|nr:hypothetical protein [Nocardioides sp.]
MIRRTLPALVVVAALSLAGCGGAGSSEPGAGGSGGTGGSSGSGPTASTQSGGPSQSPSSSSAVVQGVTLTAQGSQLRLGQTARVSWKPDQKTVGVIAVSVTRLQKMPISAFSDWRLNAATQRSTPYFVHATVRNLGRSNLSGKPVPLYLLDQRNTLLQASTFQASYAACPSRPLPAKFTRKKKTRVCLVYFAPDHGRLVAVSFRPTQDFVAITWEGAVSKPRKR